MRFTTGSKALDFIFGGYEPGVITEFYGVSQSCKTTLCCYVPIGQIYRHWKKTRPELLKSHKFYIVDGDGGFDFERAAQVWKGMGCTDEEVEEIISRISYFQPTAFAEQHNVIMHTIPELITPLKKDQAKGAVPVPPLLLAADPLIAIYRDKMLTTPRKFKMVQTGEYTGKLGMELNKFRHLSVKFRCPCLVSSWPGSPVRMHAKGEVAKQPEQPMIGGRAFGFMGKIIIELTIPVDRMPMRKAILIKHRAKPVGLEAVFRLTGKGIEDIIATGKSADA